MYSSVPKLKETSFVRASRARHRPSEDRDFFSVHPGLKCAAREGLDRSLKGISASPNTPLCAGPVARANTVLAEKSSEIFFMSNINVLNAVFSLRQAFHICFQK